MRTPAPRPVPAAFMVRRAPSRLVLLGLLASAALAWLAPAARAADQSLGIRQTPLAYSPEYGEIAPSDPGTGTGTIVVSTREGAEVRLATSPAGDPVGIVRTVGVVEGVAARGARAILFQGGRGFTALDIATPANPTVTTSVVTPNAVRMGALLADGSCVAASDSFAFVYRLEPGGDYTLLSTISYSDGRVIRRVRAHGDSILVVAARPGVLARLYATVYQLPAGATSVSLLHEWISNGKGANDAVWLPPMAFIADGNAGIYPLNTATGVYATTATATGGALIRAIDATSSDLFAAEEGQVVERFARSGTLGETLNVVSSRSTAMEPMAVGATDDSTACLATRDVI